MVFNDFRDPCAPDDDGAMHGAMHHRASAVSGFINEA